LREGAQLVQSLADLPTLDDAAGSLRTLDERGLKAIALAAVLSHKWDRSTEDGFRGWAYGDSSES
jgi:hypothetical protein